MSSFGLTTLGGLQGGLTLAQGTVSATQSWFIFFSSLVCWKHRTKVINQMDFMVTRCHMMSYDVTVAGLAMQQHPWWPAQQSVSGQQQQQPGPCHTNAIISASILPSQRLHQGPNSKVRRRWREVNESLGPHHVAHLPSHPGPGSTRDPSTLAAAPPLGLLSSNLWNEWKSELNNCKYQPQEITGS